MSRRARDLRRRLSGRAQTSSNRCRKLRYTTLEAAQAAADLRAHDDRYPPKLRAYPCPRCLGFHVTSQVKRSP